MGVWRWTKSAGGGAASQGVRANAGSNVQQGNSNNVALSGSATNGTAPYTYAWTVLTQPAGVTSASITSATSASATLTGLSATVDGMYVCKLTVTDAGGFLSVDRVGIEVTGAPYAPSWTDVADIDLTSATATTITTGTTTVVDGYTWFCRLRSGDGTMSAAIMRHCPGL